MRYLFVFITLFIVFVAPAQETFNAHNKFSVQLPDEFKGNRKLLMKVVDLLEYTVAQLKDKQMCLDCEADYWVSFYISDPNSKNLSNYSSYYSFTSFMDVYDTNYTIIKRIYLNNEDNFFKLSVTSSFTSFNSSGMVSGPAQAPLANIGGATTAFLSNDFGSSTNLNYIAQDLNRINDYRLSNIPVFNNELFEFKKVKKPTTAQLWNNVKEIILRIKIPKTE